MLATIVGGGCASLLALGFPLGALARATSVVLLLVSVLVNATLVRLHRRGPAPPRAATVPHWVPIQGVAASALALVFHALAF